MVSGFALVWGGGRKDLSNYVSRVHLQKILVSRLLRTCVSHVQNPRVHYRSYTILHAP